MPFFQQKKQLAEKLAAHFNHPEITAAALEADFSTPPNIAMGHLALPCFRLAKLLRKGPPQITADIVAAFNSPTLSVTTAGPYANFRFNPDILYRETMTAIDAQKDRYGSDTTGANRRIILEYCSPNVAKKLAFHHIRSTLIGNTLANIYEFLGYPTERINFIGDWGTQFARLLAAVERWGDRKKLTMDDVMGAMDHLLELYVRFHKESEGNTELLDSASRAAKRLEDQEAEATKTWQLIRQISVTAMERTLKPMHIRFNHIEGESHYVPQIERTLEEVKTKAQARLSEGAWIVEVEGIQTPALVQKKDGTTLYLTRDIAAAIDRFQRFHFEKMYYVVGGQQQLHFQLLKGVLKKMGYEWAENCEHLHFGTVLFGSEKMSTREGRVIELDGLLKEATALALVECTQKNPDLPNKEQVAEMVGVGAVVFGELSAHRTRDIEFDWKSVLALDGETGPYVQYSAVRCQSLMEKARAKGEAAGGPFEYSQELAIEEEALILALARFRQSLHDVTRENEPYHLTHYLIDLAKTFNRFYYKHPVLQATDADQRRMRLNLVQATGQALMNGLNLLGISCPKEM